MKRKILSLVLVLALLTAALPPFAAADNTGLCFTATNDKLLDLSSAAVNVGGNMYVPARVYSAFGIYYSYFTANSTGMLYNGSKQIYFDLNAGNSYDSYGDIFTAAAVLHNNQVYVPATWTCRYFGLSISAITGVGYGDIVRLKDANVSLSDASFLDSVNSAMKYYYYAYSGGPVSTPTPTPTPTPAVSQPEAETTGKAGTTTLCFIGLPAASVLDQLGKYGYTACFFLTADEAASSPDTVRRIYGSGYGIGIYCKSSPESECPAARDAIYAAAQVRPILMSSAAAAAKACTAYAQAHGYAYYAQRNAFAESIANASTVTTRLESAGGRTVLTFVSGTGTNKLLPSLLQYLATNKYTVQPLLETGV